MLPLSPRENPWWLILMACFLPRYTSRLEILQKLLFTGWLVPLKPNINTCFLKLSPIMIIIAENWLSIAAAVGMRDVESIGTMATLHPIILIIVHVRYHYYLGVHTTYMIHTIEELFIHCTLLFVDQIASTRITNFMSISRIQSVQVLSAPSINPYSKIGLCSYWSAQTQQWHKC